MLSLSQMMYFGGVLTVQDDSKPNREAVPSAVAVSGEFKRIFVFLFKLNFTGYSEELIRRM